MNTTGKHARHLHTAQRQPRFTRASNAVSLKKVFQHSTSSPHAFDSCWRSSLSHILTRGCTHCRAYPRTSLHRPRISIEHSNLLPTSPSRQQSSISITAECNISAWAFCVARPCISWLMRADCIRTACPASRELPGSFEKSPSAPLVEQPPAADRAAYEARSYPSASPARRGSDGSDHSQPAKACCKPHKSRTHGLHLLKYGCMSPMASMRSSFISPATLRESRCPMSRSADTGAATLHGEFRADCCMLDLQAADVCYRFGSRRRQAQYCKWSLCLLHPASA